MCGRVPTKNKFQFNRYKHLNRKMYRPLCDVRSLAAPTQEVRGELAAPRNEGWGGVRQAGMKLCGRAEVQTCAREECNCVDMSTSLRHCAPRHKERHINPANTQVRNPPPYTYSPIGATHPLTHKQHPKQPHRGDTTYLPKPKQ